MSIGVLQLYMGAVLADNSKTVFSYLKFILVRNITYKKNEVIVVCWGKIKLYFEKTEYFRIASAAECSTGYSIR